MFIRLNCLTDGGEKWSSRHCNDSSSIYSSSRASSPATLPPYSPRPEQTSRNATPRHEPQISPSFNASRRTSYMPVCISSGYVTPNNIAGRSPNVSTPNHFNYGMNNGPLPSTPCVPSVPYKNKQNNVSYDINNIVIPFNTINVTKVEHVEYKEILTPAWKEDKAIDSSRVRVVL